MFTLKFLVLCSLVLLASGQLPLPSNSQIRESSTSPKNLPADNQSTELQPASSDPLECWEIVGYLKGLHRFYDRKCTRMGKRCPGNYPYAIQWFEQASNMLDGACGCIAGTVKLSTQ